MEWLASEDPIVACSTGVLESTAISVIRISGIEELSSLQSFFKKDLSKVRQREATYLRMYKNEVLLDEVVLTYFKAPNSYNGEDIVELSVHGNPLNVQRIIKELNGLGVRNAEPGEITYRALRNKKLTMSQVEGLDTLLNARSLDLIDQGLSSLGGALEKEFVELKNLYLNLKSSIEIMIDFSEDVGEEQAEINFKSSFNAFLLAVRKLEQRTRSPRSHLLKPKVVLMGVTNAGKSTLFNLLINEQRAIVSNTKGTTRDYISEYFFYKGVEFQLVDTAGIRESEDEIEVQGIQLSKKLYEESFFKVLVINPTLEDSKYIPELSPDAVVFTHADNQKFLNYFNNFKEILKDIPKYYSGSIGPVTQSGPIGPDFDFGPIGPSSQTAPMGPKDNGPIEPLQELKDLISSKYSDLLVTKPILPERQRNNIRDLSSNLEKTSRLIDNINDPAIISNEINNLDSFVSALLGISSPEDVLNNIFSNFCIGK